MSNPCINRWGLNTFWSNMWFTDFNYSSTYRQDSIFIKLIELYLFYGLNLTYNVFTNRYWYSTYFDHLAIKSYRRWVIRKPNQFGEIMKYSLRQEADCLFPMKIWLMRYDNWLVINQYWFNPLKRKRMVKANENPNHLDSLNLLSTPQINRIQRFKNLFLRNVVTRHLRVLYYCF